MFRSLPSRYLPLAVSLALAGLTVAPAAAQSTAASVPTPATVERYDDPVRNGVAIGAALGAIGGVVFTGALFNGCHSLCDTPDNLPTYAMYAGLGAGAGAGIGFLVDKLHKGKRSAALPVALAIRADRQERALRLQWRF